MVERPPSRNPWLRMSPLPRAIGVVMFVVGLVWTLQGVGIAEGSVMTDSTFWAVVGILLIVGGMVVLRRALNAAKSAIEADEPPQ